MLRYVLGARTRIDITVWDVLDWLFLAYLACALLCEGLGGDFAALQCVPVLCIGRTPH